MTGPGRDEAHSSDPAVPVDKWAWKRRLPNLNALFGGYFHQDAQQPTDELVEDFVTHSHEDECADTLSELAELRRLCPHPKELRSTVEMLGADVRPTRAKEYPAWLDKIEQHIRRHLDAIGYDPAAEPAPRPTTVADPASRPATPDLSVHHTLELIAASTYETDEDAQRFAQRVIDDHKAEIIRWLEDAPEGSTKGFEMLDVGAVTGRCLARSNAAARPVTGARVVLRADPDSRGGWYVLTTYPIG